MYERLYENNKALLKYVAYKYSWLCKLDPAYSLEDLIQVGFIGLVKAQRTFTEDKGKTWGRWATWYIVKEIYCSIGIVNGRRTKAHISALSLDEPADYLENLARIETIEDDNPTDFDEQLNKQDLVRCVREAIDRLRDERQRNVIKKCYLECWTHKQTAETMGVSGQWIAQLRRKALNQLKKDKKLRTEADIEAETPYFAKVNPETFLRTRTSATEIAALWRIEQKELLKIRELEAAIGKCAKDTETGTQE